MKFTVITPVYNRADCVGRCIESVARNIASNPNVEVEHIVVDDGSSDNTPAILEAYAAKMPHLKFIRFDKNKGPNAARNAAVRESTGEWCIILDSDDFFVDDAMAIVSDTINTRPGYAHYTFAPDDRVESYRANPLLSGPTAIITYHDFLAGRVSGDFVHVIATETMRAFPFDERLRIHEGVFFLRFYRHAQKVFFTHTIVTIRERSRGDSVTREMVRTSVPLISRQAIYLELFIKFFGTDLVEQGLGGQLRSLRCNLIDNYLLLGQYDEAAAVIKDLSPLSGKKEQLLGLIARLHCGKLYRLMLKTYLTFKYDVLHHPLG